MFSFFFFYKAKLFYEYLSESLRKQQLRGILLNIYVFNFINFTKLCSLLATFGKTKETFQRCLNVVVRVIWRRDVGQCQINVFNIEIYNVEQRQINVVYFNVDVRLRPNNVVIFNVEFHNFVRTLINMTIFKKLNK